MRWVTFEGCGHFRDVGGYPTDDGRTTRTGVLYRAGSLDALTRGDVQKLQSLGVRTVVDLRTPDERASAMPWNEACAIDVVNLPCANPATATLAAGVFDPGALYEAAIDDRVRDVPVVLSLLAEAERRPVVVACTGGKDRTGMVVALVLGVLGVPDETIVADYVVSDEFMTRDPDGYAAALERVVAAGWDPEVLRTRPATMVRFLHAVRARFGSLPGFAAAAGVSDDVVARARENLLEP